MVPTLKSQENNYQLPRMFNLTFAGHPSVQQTSSIAVLQPQLHLNLIQSIILQMR